jgi:uncharacterized membrane protein
MTRLNLCRWSLIGLIVVQAVWFGWMVPMEDSTRMIVLALAAGPLMVALPFVWRLTPRALVVTGLMLLVYFLVGVSEAWANPAVRAPAVFQVFLILAYFTGLATIRRRSPAPAD